MASPVSQRFTASLGGLHTEGNELLSAEGTNISESNAEILRDGTRRRRRPIVEETEDRLNYLTVGADTGTSTYLWNRPGLQPDTSIVVEQIGDTVRFYEVDHNDPQYVRNRQLGQDIILRYWGIGTNLDVYSDPCTYAEGNGSLYIFHPISGTIRVDYNENPPFESVRFNLNPIGTWVRDFEGAAEQNSGPETRISAAGRATFNGSPMLPGFDDLGSDLPLARSYNLSNQGWPGDAIAEFAEESSGSFTLDLPFLGPTTVPGGPNIYPATTDRYIDGRSVTDGGEDIFSAQQLLRARKDNSQPPQGSRIGSSDYHPAGFRTSKPFRVPITSFVTTPTGVTIRVTMPEPVAHSVGVDDDNLAMFIHKVRYNVLGGGQSRLGGHSGVVNARRVAGDTDNTQLEFDIVQPGLNTGTITSIESLWVHSPTQYTPHRLPDNLNAFDYRNSDRPRSGAFFSGRLWQTGDRHNRLYYSQLVPTAARDDQRQGENIESFCFSAGDPTHPDDNALVETDGGFLSLSDSGTHFKCEVLGNTLFVFTDNGIWSVSGGNAGYFTATDFRLRKESGAETLGPKAVAHLGSEIHVATDQGILAVRVTENGVEIVNLTDTKLRRYYDELIDSQREPVGEWDPDTKVVRWAFPLIDAAIPVGEAQPMLTWMSTFDAWYRYELGPNAVVRDMIVLPYTARTPTYNRFRYFITSQIEGTATPLLSEWGVEVEFGPDGVGTWVEQHDPATRFSDFHQIGIAPRLPVPSEMTSAHITLGDGSKWNHITYLTAFNRAVTTNWIDEGDGSLSENVPGGNFVQALWDWTDNAIQNKFSNPQQTYRFRRSYLHPGTSTDYERGEPLLVAKVKVRGRGREFRIRWTNDGHNDWHLVGWNIDGTVNEVT